ncbi:MAG: ABC transporter permease [Solirubrobacteraceae bacterium]
MTRSALARKSITDLTRRRARTLLAVCTLAIAVASIGIFALPPLADRAMQKEIASSRIPDLTIDTKPLPLSGAELAALRRLPNVTAVEPRAFFATRVYLGARRAKAFVIGVPDFARQSADVVHVPSGAAPGPGAVLTDVQNARHGRDVGGAGGRLRIITGDGRVRSLRISGEGRNLAGGQLAISESAVVLYATPQTVARLSGKPGYSTLAFRLRDPGRADATIAAVHSRLRANPAFTGFADLPSVRAPGDWPGKQIFNRFTELLYIITVLALVSALVLVANTMTTLVGEQTSEIGTMKAIGGRPRQIAGVYLRTALVLGALGSLLGIALGLVLANVLVRFFGSTFFAISAGVGVDVPVLLASLALGLIGPPLAALPAIRRGVRIPVREALEATGSATGGQSALDRALRRIRFLPRSVQIGVRSIGRRKRRSLATILQVGFAVATLLAVLALGTSVANLTHAAWRDHRFQIWTGTSMQQPFDRRAAALIRSTPGVAGAQPAITNDVKLRGKDAFAWALPARSYFGYELSAGRWYTAAEERARARVAVVERTIANATGTRVGSVISLRTATGPAAFRVVGIAGNVQENGTVVFTPLTTMQDVLHAGDAVNAYWIRTTSGDHPFIDATTTRVEDTLATHGYEVGTEVTYVGERDNVAANRILTGTITVLGFIVVAISMIGLVSAITMSVLERTREIGILRCIGGRARHIRRIFTAEGLTLALIGWVVGIPLGYALDRFLIWLFGQVIEIDLGFVFPPVNLLIALVGTVVLALLILLVSVRRAVRMRPGDALRYA